MEPELFPPQTTPPGQPPLAATQAPPPPQTNANPAPATQSSQPPASSAAPPGGLQGNTEPVTRTVDPATETTRGQLQSLFAEGSPLLVQARESAQRMMAGRGLQNSSFAAQAGEQALFSSALPIAQADANVYGQAAAANNQVENTFALQNRQHVQSLEQIVAQGDQQSRLAGLQYGYERDLTVLRGDIASQQANQDFANRLVELATQGDIQSKLQLEQFGFQKELSALENLQRLEQLAAQGDVNSRLQLEQFQYQSLLADKEIGAQLQLEDIRFQNNQSMVMLEYAERGVLSEQEARQEMERLNQQHENTLAQIAAQAETATTTDSAAAGRALQNNYLLAVSERQRAASQEIAQIYQTQGLTASQQNAAVENAYNRMRADIQTLQSYYAASPLWDPDFDMPSITPPLPAHTMPPGNNIVNAPGDGFINPRAQANVN